MTDKPSLETQISLWRDFLSRHPTIHASDMDELEDHLRSEVRALGESGLAPDEAFLVAVKRMGRLDALSREFAREHSERLWKQLVLGGDGRPGEIRRGRGEIVVAVALAVLAALSFKLPELFGYHLFSHDAAAQSFYARNLSLFVLPFLVAYLVWKRRPGRLGLLPIALSFGGALVFANAYPLGVRGDTLGLTILHLPIALWLAVGVAYVGGDGFRGSGGRMDFVRFSGEGFIYYALIALGGGVLAAFTQVMFKAIGLDPTLFISRWLLPCGALGAVVICAWLVEAKQSVIENMAPVLTRIFTPLFTAVLLSFLITMAWMRQGIHVERNVLIGFDLLLAVVVGLLLYAISARDPERPSGAFDVLQLLLVLSALAVDGVALVAIASRISTFGFSPNKVAALGENVVLLVSLVGSAWLYIRFLYGRGTFASLERWQTAYLPVYSLWGWFVVALFPPLFAFR